MQCCRSTYAFHTLAKWPPWAIQLGQGVKNLLAHNDGHQLNAKLYIHPTIHSVEDGSVVVHKLKEVDLKRQAFVVLVLVLRSVQLLFG